MEYEEILMYVDEIAMNLVGLFPQSMMFAVAMMIEEQGRMDMVDNRHMYL